MLGIVGFSPVAPMKSALIISSDSEKYEVDLVMGNNNSGEISTDELDEYAQLLYLKKSEVLHLYERGKELGPEVRSDRTFGYDVKTIGLAFPEIRHNPFLDRIMLVFSSNANDKLSFEDVLDFFSATSPRCPEKVKALWAFKLYDFDGDGQLGRNDVVELINRLIGSKNPFMDEPTLEDSEKEAVADAMLGDLDLDKTGGIISAEFVHAVMKIPDFALTFKINP